LREALGDNPDQPIYVETVPKARLSVRGSIGTPMLGERRFDPTAAVSGPTAAPLSSPWLR
jgi:hypothetical protein